ncbi:MAG: glutamate 5-kinase [Myxococcales bacterium]|nr:glutamate 5-kinase [Myxococcales bacterium]
MESKEGDGRNEAAESDEGRAHQRARRSLCRARRVVVKIGSSAFTDAARPSASDQSTAGAVFDRFAAMTRDLLTPAGSQSSKRRSKELVLVSSGAIALGLEHLGMTRRPGSMPALQAAAATGQGLLMQRYGEAFGAHGLKVAQVLLTHADLANRARANNAREALTKLLHLRVTPIINENDAVAVDEIRFGDNDELAAMVASLIGADLLILLSDVDGLLDLTNRRVPFVAQVDERTEALIRETNSSVGRGGMKSKLESARRATLAGTPVVIASSRMPNVLERVLAGHDVGTLLPALGEPVRARKHWIAYTLRPRGAATVDAGAALAIVRDRRSVLCVGVTGVRGSFVEGELISILAADGTEIARGLARLSISEATRLAGVHTEKSEPLVHRDDLVVLATTS